MKIIFILERRGILSYNTKQKDLILDVVLNYGKEFTVNDIYLKLNAKVGLTTIYRLIDKMVADNRLKKYIGNNNITYYQYLCSCDEENHFYLKCSNCGCLEHIDCDCIETLEKHILKEHGFQLNKKGIVINGLCCKCK